MSAGAAAIQPGNANSVQNPSAALNSTNPKSQAILSDTAATAESNAQVQASEAQDNHTEFRNLTLLLCFLTAINEGSPTLHDRQTPKLRELARKKGGVLDAVTTILVRNHEVIAAAPFNNGAGGLVCVEQASDSIGIAHSMPAPKPMLKFVPFDGGIDIDVPYTDDQSTKDVLNVTAISNPDLEDKYQFLPALPCVPKLISGNNFWPEVAQKGHGAAKQIGKMKLADHMETICSYLNEYKAATPERQKDMSGIFVEYLVMSCWKRIYRRCIHWTSLGLLFLLVESTETLQSAIDKNNWVSHIRDRTLDGYLKALANNPEIMGFLMGASPLMKASDVSNDFHQVLCVQERPSEHEVYSKHTAHHFHGFLIAILMGYTRSLAELKVAIAHANQEAQPKGRKFKKNGVTSSPWDAVQKQMKVLSPFVRALFILAHSNALTEHLRLLTTPVSGKMVPLKMVPLISSKHIYVQFAIDHELLPAAPAGVSNHEKPIIERDEDEDGTDADSEDGTHDQKGEPEDTDSEDGDELAEGVKSDPFHIDYVVLRKLILAYVAPFSAKHILERHSMQLCPGLDVRLKLISVPRSKTVVASWQYMETLILGKGGISDWAPHAPNHIDTIRKHILAFNTATSESRSTFPHIYSIFEHLYFDDLLMKQKGKAGEAEPIYFPGNKHCEAILAAFLLYFDPSSYKLTTEEDVKAIQDLQALRKDLQGRHISVSKLCCPVCWELMKILRDPNQSIDPENFNQAFKVRGRHNILYDVDLPSSLPEEILKGLITRFKYFLSKELYDLRAPPVISSELHKYSHASSLEHDSATSVA